MPYAVAAPRACSRPFPSDPARHAPRLAHPPIRCSASSFPNGCMPSVSRTRTSLRPPTPRSASFSTEQLENCAHARARRRAPVPRTHEAFMQQSSQHSEDELSSLVNIPTGRVMLIGDLIVPSTPGGIVVFAHGSGSSRTSPRNRSVAEALVHEGFATLLFDLLTREE